MVNEPRPDARAPTPATGSIDPTHGHALSRREALALAALAGVAGSVGGIATAHAGDQPQGSHDGMDHGAHDHAHMKDAKYQKLIDSAVACLGRGETCVAHCIPMLGAGDTSLAACLTSVHTMMPMCQALARLAALESKRLREFVKVCRDVCADCEEECKKHADKHAVCKACAEACASCIKECNAVLET